MFGRRQLFNYLFISYIPLILLFFLSGIFFDQFYLKTGQCKFGLNCIFHHPKDLQLPSREETTKNAVNGERTEYVTGNPVSFPPALFHNSKGLPMRSVCYHLVL